MGFEYNWQNNEANFGPPTQNEVDGGTHVTVDILLKKEDKYFALRRQCVPGHEAPPHSPDHPMELLFICHNLIRYAEPIEQCVQRIVKEQSGVNVLSYQVEDLRTTFLEESGGKKIKQWAVIPFIIAEVDKTPEVGNYGNEVTEVVSFTKNNIPVDFAFEKRELIERIINRRNRLS